jgi:hypothetical protein
MGTRILIAGIVGGIVMFCWGAVSHTALPLGDMGLKSIPNEPVVMSALTQSFTEPGFYMFPSGPDNPTAEQEAEWTVRYKAGPIGVIAYEPKGREPMGPMQLLSELAFNVLSVMLAAFVVARTASSYVVRVVCFMLFGVIGWTSISTSHWTWHAFPTDFVVGELVIEAAGWLLAGVVAGAIARPRIKIAVSV